MQTFQALTSEQQENPLLALQETSQYASPEEMKTMLWEWYKTTVNGSFNRVSRRNRSEITFTYELVLKLFGALDLINKQKQL
ncbi:MAG TPA: hypothetical protein VK616_19385 [Flavitalea sp.]|nr:hypothetical protein [Flavitalea sp.]HTF27404.1 hypothetical protein [Flavitalea sp.]